MSDGEPDTEGSPEREGDVERVLDALTPFIEQADTLAGVSVTYARDWSADSVLDPTTVEVRFHIPERHPKEADMAMGMLQGHGFSPEKLRRGHLGGGVCICLTVPVTDAPADPNDRPKPQGDGEQSTIQ